MKVLRIGLAVLGALIVLVIVAAIIVVRTFDPNDYKDELTAYVQERTGRTLTIENSIEWSLFPWLAVETGGVRLSDDERFGDRSFMTIDELSARVRLWPLLRRRVEIGTVILDGVVLNLGINAEGEANWQSLLTNRATTETAQETADSGRRPIEQLAVEGIEIRDARVLWHDTLGEVAYIARDINLETGAINDNDPVDVALTLSVLDVASRASVDIDLRSTATRSPEVRLDDIRAGIVVLDSREQRRADAELQLDRLDVGQDGWIRAGRTVLTADLLRPPIGPENLAVEIALDAAELDMSSGNTLVSGLRTGAGGLEAEWQLRIESLFGDASIDGVVTAHGDSLAELADMLELDLPADASAGGIDGRAAFTAGLAPIEATVDDYVISMLGIEARGSAELFSDGTVSLSITVPSFSPNESLLALVEPRLPDGVDVRAINALGGNAALVRPAGSSELAIDDFVLTLDQARVAGSLTMTDPAASSSASGTIRASNLDNRLLTALFGTWLPADLLDADIGDFELRTEFVHNAADNFTVLESLALTAYGLSAQGQLTIVDQERSGNLTLNGQAQVARFSPRALLARFDLPAPQSQDSSALSSATIAAGFETNGENGAFRDLVIELDDSRITGEFDVTNFADPSYRFVLRADRIDVDRYLPPRAADAEGNERKLGEMRLAPEPLTATVISGTASVGHLRVGGMDFDQLGASLALGSGRMDLTSVETQLYGGRFTGNLSVDATGEIGQVRLAGNASAVALRPLLDAMLGSSNLSGTGNVELDLAASGATINEVLQTAAGTMSVALRDGEIDGVNVGRELCRVVNARRGLPAPAAAPEATRFSVIRASATVADGIAATEDLYATTGYLDLTGRGGIRLVDQWLDLQHQARLTGSVPVAGCERLNAVIADDPIPVNFTLKGRLPDVDIGFDVSQLLSDWARRELRNRAEEEIRDRIIRGLLN